MILGLFALSAGQLTKIKIIGIATGGKIEQICNKNNILLVKIPSGIQPRSATGYMFSVLAKTAGVRRETIEFLEQGKYNPSLNLAHNVAGALKVSIDKLFIFND